MTMYHSHKKKWKFNFPLLSSLETLRTPCLHKAEVGIRLSVLWLHCDKYLQGGDILYKELHITLKLSLKSSDATNVAPQNTNLLEPKDFRFFLTHVNYETL